MDMHDKNAFKMYSQVTDELVNKIKEERLSLSCMYFTVILYFMYLRYKN